MKPSRKVLSVVFWLPLLSLPIGTSLAAEFPADMKNQQSRISTKDVEESRRDPLAIGGKAKSSLIQFQFENHENDFMFNPSRLELYLDARRKGDVRFLTRGSFTYDPTINEDAINMVSGHKEKKSTGNLDEMKLMFNAKKKVFFTIGKQKIRWGSAHFFNPTDFVNSTNRDPLSRDDERSGVSLIKMHMPIGSSNLYVIDKMDDAQKLDHTALAGRFEFAFKSAELAVSALTQKEKPSRYGVDLSMAVFDFDFYVESAIKTSADKIKYGPDYSPDAPENSFASYQDKGSQPVATTTTGFAYDYKYGLNHTLTLVAEYFNNPEGYGSKEEYRYPLLARSYEAFRLGQNYAMVVLYLPKPLTLGTLDLSMTHLANLTDQSFLSRLTARSSALEDLIMEFNVTRYHGESQGEFRLSTMVMDYSASLEMAF